MRVANQTPFLAGTKVTSRAPPKPEMTVIVRGTFVLSPAEPLRVPDGPYPLSQGGLTAEVVTEDEDGAPIDCEYPGDFADFKPRPEVMVRGVCHPPKGHPAKEHLVRVAVGEWSKTARIPSGAAAPFGPVSQARPERASKLGKDYGPEYKASRAPFYSADFDWSHFNAAPPDQWLDALKGDEAITLGGLHSEARSFSKKLPGLRIRAFVKDTSASVREVPMRLDTVFADMGSERLYLTFRGLTPVAERDLSDVATLLVVSEALSDPPRPAAHYEAALDAFERDPGDVDAGVPEHLRDLARGVREDRRGTGIDIRPSGPASAAATASASAPASAGAPAVHASPPLDGAASGAKPRKGAGKGATPDPLSAFLATRLAHLPAAEQARVQGAIATLLRQPVPPGTNLRRAIADALGKVAPPAAAPPPVSLDTPRAPVGGALSSALDRLAASEVRAAREGVPGGAGQAAALREDPRLRALDPALGAATPPGRERLVPGADLRGKDLRGRDLSGLDLTGADLSDALLSGAKLRGAVLVSANLTRAALDGADLTGADLQRANLTLAGLTEATAESADLRGATLDRVNARRAKLTRANLTGAQGPSASFEEAVLDEAKLVTAVLAEAVFDGASLLGCDLARAQLPKSRFLRARAAKASFERAVIAGASFAGADLSSARFVEASGKGAIFSDAKLDRADLRYAQLREAHFAGAHGEGAMFRAAELREARFYRASLPRATFTQANLFGADLCKAAVPRARFDGANLYDAKLLEADVSGCDFAGAILRRSTLEKA